MARSGSLHDLLVIGAGPAGCAAALSARRAGLDVAMVESQPAPRPGPGETLHPGIEPLLETLGIRDEFLKAGFHRHRGVWVNWSAGRHFQPYGGGTEAPWYGFQADRSQFGSILKNAVRREGIPILHSPPGTLERRAGPSFKLTTPDAILSSRWIADGTGARSLVASCLGVGTIPFSPPLRVKFGWRPGWDPVLEGQPELSAAPGGWVWRAPLDGNRTAWVQLEMGSVRSIPAGKSALTWTLRECTAGPGWFLLGDAAAVIDPASSNGVARALMSGILCAHLIGACESGKLSRHESAEIYDAEIRDRFGASISRLGELYRSHPVDGEFAACF